MASKRWAEPADAAAFFADSALGLAAYRWSQAHIDALGGAELRVATTQVGWARRRGFAFLWRPDQVLGERGAPLVVSLDLASQDPSPRWKQVVEVRPGRSIHHLEVRDERELDDEVAAWLERAYQLAG